MKEKEAGEEVRRRMHTRRFPARRPSGVGFREEADGNRMQTSHKIKVVPPPPVPERDRSGDEQELNHSGAFLSIVCANFIRKKVG